MRTDIPAAHASLYDMRGTINAEFIKIASDDLNGERKTIGIQAG